ncbi:MAG: hypothetical protein GEV28_01420 [Actinophytocola sp.]|uniref:hypothetical protein n=1 Tax=Actinophytocola sp. TaxID=1872138 RepID=UPI001323E064|nr:hypothetical protein [Actinophytocola sp.]MPZ79117.1 hypothetical protein [Actinophytocola sp.]
MTSVTVLGLGRTGRALAGALPARVPSYLDGGIMAIPSMIATPGAVLLHSGPLSSFRRVAAGDRALVVGPLGYVAPMRAAGPHVAGP